MIEYYEPLLKNYITLIICDRSKAKKKIEEILEEETDEVNSEARTYRYVTKIGEERILIWLGLRSERLLVHELVHVVEYSLKMRNIPFNSKNAEIIAYYMEHLWEKLEGELNK